MSWLSENKEWIFSGVGVAIAGGIITYLIEHLKKHKAEPRVNVTLSMPQPPTKDTTLKPNSILQMTVQQILDDINSRPPFQRDEAKKHYIGTRVRFSGIFSSLIKKDKNYVRVTLRPLKGFDPSVNFIINVDDYPEFKVIRENTPLTVEGMISGFVLWEVQLDVISLSSGSA